MWRFPSHRCKPYYVWTSLNNLNTSAPIPHIWKLPREQTKTWRSFPQPYALIWSRTSSTQPVLEVGWELYNKCMWKVLNWRMITVQIIVWLHIMVLYNVGMCFKAFNGITGTFRLTCSIKDYENYRWWILFSQPPLTCKPLLPASFIKLHMS